MDTTLKTLIREYWDRRPCNVNHAPGQKYLVEPHIPGFADFYRWRGKRVLEIGCGVGWDTETFVMAGAHVIGVDISGESLRIARKRVPNVVFFENDAETFVPNMHFDLVYAFGVLHHTPHPEEILKRIKLTPTGELRIMLYAKWSIKYLTRQQPEAQAGCPLAKFYSAREARKLLEDNGFRILSMRKTHIFPYKVKDYIEKRFIRKWYYRYMPKPMFSWLESVLGHHLLIRAVKA